MDELIFRSDWLASRPYFYNINDNLASSEINQVCVPDLPFHDEGLRNFLDFGYSVFGQTPLSGVKFMQHSSKLLRNEHGSLYLEKLDDEFVGVTQSSLKESEVFELIKDKVRAWEDSLPPDQEIILPLSGGFDSRLLLWCVREKERIRAFTFGLTDNQHDSFEVVIAKKLAKQFKLNWEWVEISDYHRFFPVWHEKFGISTHAHGMYQMEFYEIVSERLNGQKGALLSGIVGDAWAGSIRRFGLDSPSDLSKLAYSHDLRCDPGISLSSVESDLRDEFWEDHRYQLSEPDFQLVTIIRFKLILLSYLYSVPEMFGHDVWSPFLDQEVALAMMNLPAKRRAGRRWQADFFKKVEMDYDGYSTPRSRRNNMALQALRKQPLKPLNIDLLQNTIDPSYLHWVNNSVKLTLMSRIGHTLATTPVLSGVLRRAGLTPGALRAYNAYRCLYPLAEYLETNQNI